MIRQYIYKTAFYISILLIGALTYVLLCVGDIIALGEFNNIFKLFATVLVMSFTTLFRILDRYSDNI